MVARRSSMLANINPRITATTRAIMEPTMANLTVIRNTMAKASMVIIKTEFQRTNRCTLKKKLPKLAASNEKCNK